ncbi:MAG: MFS transporter [Candidatus Omnitrophota bacterium]
MKINYNGIDFKHTLRALCYRNYRLFFTGQVISLIGTWMQYLAMSWLVYRLTNSLFALGAIGFASQITAFFVSPFSGVWADRWNRHRILIVTQILAMLQAFVLAWLVMSGVVRVWHIIVLSVFLGVVNSFDMPVRQSFTFDMIRNKQDLGNAIALNSLMFNLARFIGPTAAGFVVALFGEGMCFLINGVSYIAVIIALFLIKTSSLKSVNNHRGIWESMKEGFVYTFGFPPMRFILILMGLVSLVVMPYAVLLPAFAKDVLHGNSRTLGILMGAAGMGALAGAVFMAAKKGVQGLGRSIANAMFMFGIGLMLLSFSSTTWLSLIIMVFIGFGIMVHMAASNTVLQAIVDDDKRGRVMGFYVMAFIGLTPFGSLFAGSLASHIGIPRTFLLAGILCILGAFIFRFKINSFNSIVDKVK